MVWAPDQAGVPAGSRRFILSLRATGEGHISSITFRSGVIDARNRIRMDDPTRYVTAPDLVPHARYDKKLFHLKLIELGVNGPMTGQVMAALGEQFSLGELEQTIGNVVRHNRDRQREFEPVGQTMVLLAKSNYEIRFGADLNVSERIIFPSSPTETNGIEDARFVRFTHADGRVCYYATYTAYDGRVTLPADARDRGLPALQGRHPERAGGPEQGVRPVPPDGERAVRRWSAGRTTRTST